VVIVDAADELCFVLFEVFLFSPPHLLLFGLDTNICNICQSNKYKPFCRESAVTDKLYSQNSDLTDLIPAMD